MPYHTGHGMKKKKKKKKKGKKKRNGKGRINKEYY